MILGVGIDIGYGQTKALASTGASAVFPSAVGLADPQTFRLHLNGAAPAATPDQTVYLNGVPYLVGEPAVRHARAVNSRNLREGLASRGIDDLLEWRRDEPVAVEVEGIGFHIFSAGFRQSTAKSKGDHCSFDM